MVSALQDAEEIALATYRALIGKIPDLVEESRPKDCPEEVWVDFYSRAEVGVELTARERAAIPNLWSFQKNSVVYTIRGGTVTFHNWKWVDPFERNYDAEMLKRFQKRLELKENF